MCEIADVPQNNNPEKTRNSPVKLQLFTQYNNFFKGFLIRDL